MNQEKTSMTPRKIGFTAAYQANRRPFIWKFWLELWLKILKQIVRQREKESDGCFFFFAYWLLGTFLKNWKASHSSKKPSPPSRPTPSSLFPLISPLSLFLLLLSPAYLLALLNTFVKWRDLSFMQALLKSNKQSIVDKERRDRTKISDLNYRSRPPSLTPSSLYLPNAAS